MFDKLLSFGRFNRMRTKTLRTTSRLLTATSRNKNINPTRPKTNRHHSLKLLTQRTRDYSHQINKKSEDEARLEELKKIAEVHKAFSEYHDSYNIHYAIVLHELAKHYGNMKDYVNSKKSFEEALKIFENCGGKMNEDVGVVCSNLAGIHYHLDNIEKSTELYERALTIFEDRYGKNDQNNAHISGIRQKLARNYYSNNIPSTWKNTQHFYSLRRDEFKTLQQTSEQTAEEHRQYFDLPPRFYNL